MDEGADTRDVQNKCLYIIVFHTRLNACIYILYIYMVHSILKVSLNVSEGLEQLQRKGQLPKYLA